MTELQRAFCAAVQNAVCSNYRTVFSKALRENAEQSFVTAIQKIALPTLNARNLPHLQPEKQLSAVIRCVESLISEASQAALHLAVQNVSDAGYGRYTQMALENQDLSVLQNLEDEMISRWLHNMGLPNVGYAIDLRLYRLLYAKELFEKLDAARRKDTNEDITVLVERVNSEALDEAYLTMAEFSVQNQVQTCMKRILKHFLCELAVWRRKTGDTDLLPEEKKIVISAFFCER